VFGEFCIKLHHGLGQRVRVLIPSEFWDVEPTHEDTGELERSRFVERVRTEAARRELESTRDTLDVIASRCGFGTTETLRRTFHRRLRTSPDAYRRRFATTAATAPTTGRTSS